ncbi:arginine--tRNA ligase [Oscillospiraceae bacterium MB08-C2-2]|nr:arginine--tRNA ligase [Oscillospiraceae bacterium MB08-C2-2]
MNNIVEAARQQINSILEAAAGKAAAQGLLPHGELPSYSIEIPGDTSHGDFAVNAAMVGAKSFSMAPRKIAEALCGNMELEGTFFQSAQVAGPGFINFAVNPSWFAQSVELIEKLGGEYGRSDYGKNEKIMVEFVSANPTGPMHMGNARGGAIGDCLAAAMDAAGYQVQREFYVNDAGNQIAKFGLSLEARYMQELQGEDSFAFPEDGYHGEDIRDRVKEYIAQGGAKLLDVESAARRQALVDYALPRNIAKLEEDLHTYRIDYDLWFRESGLYADGTVEKVVGILGEKGLTYEKDGALWYKATEFGGEKDEVLIRQGGSPTYFAADIAYHYNKFSVRGYNRVINVWGADHHGHVARLKGAMDAVGLDGSKLDIILMQLVRLMKDGQPYKMSKRTGRSVTLSDLTDLVPIDAARFFFNMREPGSPMDFDLDLAVEESSHNPVYYVQYAHARICSIQRNLEKEGIYTRPCTREELELLSQPEERELIRKLAQYPDEIVKAAKYYDPAGLTRYAMETATLFHKFYNTCKVKGEDEALMQARLRLCLCMGGTLRNLLELLKISAPELM